MQLTACVPVSGGPPALQYFAKGQSSWLAPVLTQLLADVDVPLPLPLCYLQRLQYAIEAAFDSSGATGGIATLVYDQQQVLTIPWGTTRTGGAGNNITGDTVFRLGRYWD